MNSGMWALFYFLGVVVSCGTLVIVHREAQAWAHRSTVAAIRKVLVEEIRRYCEENNQVRLADVIRIVEGGSKQP